MTEKQAKTMLRRYLGSFPSLNLHDPEIYITNLCVLFMEYPEWAGQRVLVQAKDKFVFPPTQAELRPLLEDHVRIPRYATEWEHGASKLIADRSAPLLEGPKRPKPSLEELKHKHGENWGINQTSPVDHVPAFREMCLKAGIDPEQIPDDPYIRDEGGKPIGKRMKDAQKLGRLADKVARDAQTAMDDFAKEFGFQ